MPHKRQLMKLIDCDTFMVHIMTLDPHVLGAVRRVDEFYTSPQPNIEKAKLHHRWYIPCRSRHYHSNTFEIKFSVVFSTISNSRLVNVFSFLRDVANYIKLWTRFEFRWWLGCPNTKTHDGNGPMVVQTSTFDASMSGARHQPSIYGT